MKELSDQLEKESHAQLASEFLEVFIRAHQRISRNPGRVSGSGEKDQDNQIMDAGGILLMDAGGILRKIDFYDTRNDFAAGKIDLV